MLRGSFNNLHFYFSLIKYDNCSSKYSYVFIYCFSHIHEGKINNKRHVIKVIYVYNTRIPYYTIPYIFPNFIPRSLLAVRFLAYSEEESREKMVIESLGYLGYLGWANLVKKSLYTHILMHLISSGKTFLLKGLVKFFTQSKNFCWNYLQFQPTLHWKVTFFDSSFPLKSFYLFKLILFFFKFSHIFNKVNKSHSTLLHLSFIISTEMNHYLLS
jgi:hypothetical protein